MASDAKLLAAIPRGKEWLVGVSGGLDSMVLLHLLANCSNRPPLRALHINHQLNPAANDWQQHVESSCAALDVQCCSVSVTLANEGRGLEDAARRARYRVFEQQLDADGVLLLAHHQNDQAETLLMRLLRGAGVRGMAAMPPARALGRGQLCRPLLNSTRAALQDYAAAHQLRWVEDDSNADSSFDRNYLRNEVLPIIAARWPGFADSWSRSAAAASEALELLNELARQDLPNLDLRAETFGVSVDQEAMRALSGAHMRNVLRIVLEDHGFEPMPRAQISELQGGFFSAPDDASPQVCWAGHQARRFAQRVYLLHKLPVPALGFHHRYCLGGARGQMEVTIEPLCQLQLELAAFVVEAQSNITICFRQGGERLAVSSRLNKTLKNWLQEQAVPPWLRERLPLVYVDQQLCAIGDLWSDPKAVSRVIVDFRT